MKYFEVIGNPIEHSLSPQIHQFLAQQYHITLDYKKTELDLDKPNFENYVKNWFKNVNHTGLNITVPFKQRAYDIAENLSDTAKLAKAVNTFMLKNGQLYGHNTDGLGFINDCNYHLIELKHKHVLILGAGGAVNGIVYRILMEEPASITIVNRTLEKAMQLVGELSYYTHTTYLRSCNLDPDKLIHLQTADVMINATSSSLKSSKKLSHHLGHEDAFALPDHLWHNNTVAYELAYNTQSSFLEWAKHYNLSAFDGLGMLIEQAAGSFALWHGIEEPIDTTKLRAYALSLI